MDWLYWDRQTERMVNREVSLQHRGSNFIPVYLFLQRGVRSLFYLVMVMCFINFNK